MWLPATETQRADQTSVVHKRTQAGGIGDDRDKRGFTSEITMPWDVSLSMCVLVEAHAPILSQPEVSQGVTSESQIYMVEKQ